MTKNARILLAGIIIISAILRISLAYQEPLVDYQAYDLLRQVQSIRESGVPLYDDPLSYGGRERVFAPFYYYLNALFSFFIPQLHLVKIVPNLFAALVALPVFLLSQLITKNKPLSLIAAAITVLTPASFFIGVNDGSSLPLMATLIFGAIYLFHKARSSGKHLYLLITFLTAIVIIDTVGTVLLLSLIVYLILLKLEKVPVTKKEKEIFTFFLFLTGWSIALVYKSALVEHGIHIIWQNLPAAEITNSFAKITILQAIISTGLIPLVAGAIAIYDALSTTKRKPILLLFSMIACLALLLWTKLIPLVEGIYLLAVAFVIMSSYGLKLISDLIKKTKVARFSTYAIIGIIAIFISISIPIITSITLYDAPTVEEKEVFLWAQDNIDGTILTVPQEGSFVAYYSQKKVVADQDYLLIPKAQERYNDIIKTYRSFFKTDAVGLMQKYGATHLFVSKKALEITQVEDIKFIDEKCFEELTQINQVILYERTCSLGGKE